MFLRSLTAAILGLTLVAPASALDVQLFPLTGEVRLRNPDPTPVTFVYSSITSDTSGALNPSSANWKSITENYDAPTGPTPGNGFIDATHEWTKLSATTTQLTEGVFTGPGGALPAYRSVGLGTLWNPNVVPYTNLAFDIRYPNGDQIPINPIEALLGDYNGDLVVDDADYAVWFASFGSTTSLAADGNMNGVVDLADGVIWRRNEGKSLAAAGLSLQANSVPEPAGGALAAVALVAFIAFCSARPVARRAVCRCAARR